MGIMTEYMRQRPLPKSSKLTDDQAREILARVRDGAQQRELAREYGVNPSAIHYIVHGKRKSLLPPEPLPETKTCTRCGEDKPLGEYYKDPRARDGRQSECTHCHLNGTGLVYRRLNPKKIMWRAARYRAQRQGVPFNITEDDIVIPDRCPILGIKLAMGEGQQSENSPSLDKIDPTMGYVPGNIQVISYKANAMKRDATADELLSFARWVMENMKGV